MDFFNDKTLTSIFIFILVQIKKMNISYWQRCDSQLSNKSRCVCGTLTVYEDQRLLLLTCLNF